jgi:hypothetical protein
MTIAIRYDDDTAMHACPACGKFRGIDPDGYYDCAVRCPEDERDMHPVAAFCDARCADKFHGRTAP